jgi:hypothetical protein
MISVGDTVRILRAHVGDWPNYYWAREMNATIGKEGIVLHGDGNGNYMISVDGIRTNYIYPLAVLELVGACPLGHGPNNTHLSQELPP